MVLVECRLFLKKKKVEPVKKVEKTKKKSEPLQEILEVNPNEEDGFDEEHGDEE